MGFVCAGEASDDMANDSQIEGSYDINDEPALSGVDEFEDSQLNSANELEEIDADFFSSKNVDDVQPVLKSSKENVKKLSSNTNSKKVSDSKKTFEDIQNKINKAKNGDVIVLSGTYVGSGKNIVIDKNLTIKGSKTATLNAKSLSRIFYIKSSSAVTFKNIKFVNGKTKGDDGYIQGQGAAIYSRSPLKIIKCNFTNNIAEYGGAIYTFNKIIISNCRFVKNHAYFASAINGVTTNSIIKNSKFISNTNDAGESAGVINSFGRGKVSIINCIFSKNKCGDDIIDTQFGYLILKKCKFYDNKARLGIHFDEDVKGTLVGCIFKNNKFAPFSAYTKVVVKKCKFIRNSRPIEGYWQVKLTISNSKFVTSSDNGSGSLFVKIERGGDAKIKLTKCKFTQKSKKSYIYSLILDNAKNTTLSIIKNKRTHRYTYFISLGVSNVNLKKISKAKPLVKLYYGFTKKGTPNYTNIVVRQTDGKSSKYYSLDRLVSNSGFNIDTSKLSLSNKKFTLKTSQAKNYKPAKKLFGLPTLITNYNYVKIRT